MHYQSGGYLLGVISKLVYCAKGNLEIVWEGHVRKAPYIN